jgi:hypothetical protein
MKQGPKWGQMMTKARERKSHDTVTLMTNYVTLNEPHLLPLTMKEALM